MKRVIAIFAILNTVACASAYSGIAVAPDGKVFITEAKRKGQVLICEVGEELVCRRLDVNVN